MASLDILCFNPFNLKNKIIKIEHKKIFRGPSKILKNISWPPQKPSASRPLLPSYILNVWSLASNHDGNFYCLNYLHSFRTDNALKKQEGLCDNNDYCSVEMLTQFNKTLKYNYGEKPLRTPFVIYADLELLLIKKQSCQNKSNECYTERKAIHEPCGYALTLISSFDSKQSKRSFYREKDCIKRFCSELKELATKIINYEQKVLIQLTDNEKKYYEE